MVQRAAEAKAANHTTKALITPLVEGKGEPEIKTNLVEFTVQLTIIAGIEFGDAFNCVRLREFFTYASEPYRQHNFPSPLHCAKA